MSRQSIKKWCKKNLNVRAAFPVLLLIFGLTGLLASGAIAVEKEHLLKNPSTELPCNINPVYSCSNVFLSPQSQTFGVSNEYVGIAVFAVLITLGVVLLAGAELKKWFWYAFMAGMLGFMGMVVWFFIQSVYVIGSLCIFCSIVWFSAWTITVSGFAWLTDNGILAHQKYNKLLQFMRRNVWLLWFMLILTFATLIVRHFWEYYGQYFN